MANKKATTKGKKIYNVISTVVVALVFIFLVAVVGFMLWQRRSGQDASLFGYYMFDVLTDSMKGTIEPGDVIIGKKVDANALKVGDIITFTAPSGQLKGYNITHRIVEVERGDDGAVKYFKTKGDNPDVEVDEWELSPSAIKAKYVKTSPFVKGFREFLSHWYGYVVLVVLPLVAVGALLIGGYIRDRVKLQTAEEAVKPKSLEQMSEEERQKLLDEYLATEQGAIPPERIDLTSNNPTDLNAENLTENAQNEQTSQTDAATCGQPVIADGESAEADAQSGDETQNVSAEQKCGAGENTDEPTSEDLERQKSAEVQNGKDEQ